METTQKAAALAFVLGQAILQKTHLVSQNHFGWDPELLRAREVFRIPISFTYGTVIND